MTHSAIYPGTVLHARTRPVRHRLRYRMLNLLLDLDELPTLNARLRLFGHNRRALFEFREADHGDGSATPLRDQVQAQLRAAGLKPEGGRIRVLCMPRLLGMVFNPLTVYFCDAADGTPQALLYEVNNTFGQRHSYLIPVRAGQQAVIRQRIAKDFYVSPFMDMALTYHFRVAPPGDRLACHVRRMHLPPRPGAHERVDDGALSRAPRPRRKIPRPAVPADVAGGVIE